MWIISWPHWTECLTVLPRIQCDLETWGAQQPDSRLTLWPDYWPHTPGLNHLDHTHSLKGLTAHTYIVKVVSNPWHWNPSPLLLLYYTRTTCLSTARFLLECLWFLMKNMNSYAGLNILICIVSVRVTFTTTETIIPSQYSKVCSEIKASGLPDYGGRHNPLGSDNPKTIPWGQNFHNTWCSEHLWPVPRGNFSTSRVLHDLHHQQYFSAWSTRCCSRYVGAVCHHLHILMYSPSETPQIVHIRRTTSRVPCVHGGFSRLHHITRIGTYGPGKALRP